MAICEKCWEDSGGNPERYAKLLLERSHNPCTPEEQAGGDLAQKCIHCDRWTKHMHTHKCVICGER